SPQAAQLKARPTTQARKAATTAGRAPRGPHAQRAWGARRQGRSASRSNRSSIQAGQTYSSVAWLARLRTALKKTRDSLVGIETLETARRPIDRDLWDELEE